jgi:hypothetical protein
MGKSIAGSQKLTIELFSRNRPGGAKTELLQFFEGATKTELEIPLVYLWSHDALLE